VSLECQDQRLEYNYRHKAPVDKQTAERKQDHAAGKLTHVTSARFLQREQTEMMQGENTSTMNQRDGGHNAQFAVTIN
jgi:hypothetical protein